MKKPKIVTIDDDPDILDVLRIALEANHYEVHAAASGAEGLKVIKQVRPDLIILDVMMDTVTEGFHVSYELRSQDPKSEYHEFSKTPIIMLTSISQKMGMKFSPEKDGEYLPEVAGSCPHLGFLHLDAHLLRVRSESGGCRCQEQDDKDARTKYRHDLDPPGPSVS